MMMKKKMRLLIAAALLALPLQSWAQFGDAKWIGTDEAVLYSPYLPQFRLSATLQIDRRAKDAGAAILFGGNDPRLMKREMNILGVENARDESYIKVELDAQPVRSGGQAKVNIYRRGYTTKGEELLKMLDISTGIIDRKTLYEPHDLQIACCLGTADIAIDGTPLGSVALNPLGQGGDYIAFPQLADIGHETKAGQRATLSNVIVKNYRSPYGELYAKREPQAIGKNGAAERVLYNPSHGGMPLLQTEFRLKDKPVATARIDCTARGIYQLLVNGRQASDEFFAPGISQYNKTHYYQTYDIAPLLVNGDTPNRIRVQLAEGWWAGAHTYSGGNWNYFGDQLSFIARLVVRYADGDSTVITTQPDLWQVATDGGITYASMFQGEVQRQVANTTPTFRPAKGLTLDGHLPSEGGGTTPKVDDYTNFRLLPATTRVLPYDTLTAVSVNEVRPGVYVYDMGQNMAGVPLIGIPALGQDAEIKLRYAEVLYPDLPEYGDKAGTLMLENIRAAMAQDILVTDGRQGQTFCPRFTLHGCRYVEITGIPKALPTDSVRGIVLSSVDRFTADFECSNPLVNRLWQNIRWSILANFISMPTDCPQRNERMGWSGDISVFSRTAVNMANVREFLRKHLQAMRDVQTPEGRFPDIAPIGGGFGGLLWGSAGITVPWECWLQYANLELLADHYDAMKAYIDYVESHYIDPTTGILVQERQWGDLGDWLGLEDGKNDKTLLFEAYYIYDLTILQKVARLLGKETDATRYAQQIEKRKQFFIDTYINKETGQTIASAFLPDRKGQPIDIQGSYVLPLAFDIVEGELRQKVLDNLVRTIERENTTDDGTYCPPYSLMTGFITTAWISRALSDGGRSDIAYRLLQQQDYPSWLYPVTQGATTVWERLNSYTHTAGFGGNNSMNSFNHYSFGAVGQWLINRCLGIERDEDSPGYTHFVLRPEPDPTGQMTYARGHLDTRHGRIESSWQIYKEDGSVRYEFTIPEGTSATLMLPGQEPQELEAGHHAR